MLQQVFTEQGFHLIQLGRISQQQSDAIGAYFTWYIFLGLFCLVYYAWFILLVLFCLAYFACLILLVLFCPGQHTLPSNIPAYNSISLLKLFMNYRAPPAFSLTSSLKKSISQMPLREHPGPGPIYDLQAYNSTTLKRSYSIGKAQRQAINHGIEKTPSPQHYKSKKMPVKQSISFGKAQPSNPESDVPAVGAHYPCVQPTKPKILSYSIGQKYASILTSSHANPGAGSYQTSEQPWPALSKSKNVKQTQFGTGQRFGYHYDANPGVGNYSLQATSTLLNKKTTLPQAQKLKSAMAVHPGPGDYLLRTQFTDKGQNGKTLSMRFKIPFQPKSDTVFAFGKYFEDQRSTQTLQSSQKFSFGREKREIATDVVVPGPTEYITDTFVPKNSFATIIPLSQRKEYNDTLEFPGPGSYQPKNNSGRTPAFGRSKSVTFVNNTPGPGRYQPKLLQKQSKGPKFGTEKVGQRKVAIGGSVGSYQLSGNLQLNKGSFSKSQRFGYKEQRQPGPGDYHIPDIITYHSKAQSPSKNP